MLLAMPVLANRVLPPRTIAIAPGRLKPNRFSLSIYGDPAAEIEDLFPSIRDHGILVALVVAPGPTKNLGSYFRTSAACLRPGIELRQSPL